MAFFPSCLPFFQRACLGCLPCSGCWRGVQAVMGYHSFFLCHSLASPQLLALLPFKPNFWPLRRGLLSVYSWLSRVEADGCRYLFVHSTHFFWGNTLCQTMFQAGDMTKIRTNKHSCVCELFSSVGRKMT